MDGDDQVRVVKRDHDSTALPGDMPTVSRVALPTEIFSGWICNNGFRFPSGSLDPTQSILGVSLEPHAP
jgi:hypothetical protein